MYVCMSNFQTTIATFYELGKNYEITLQNSVENVSWYIFQNAYYIYFECATGHNRNESSQPY